MSYSPPARPPPNPDTRELPPGWIEQYESTYKTWFYVNARAVPPVSSWVHPLGPPPPVAPPSYVPPPPNNSTHPGYGGDSKNGHGDNKAGYGGGYPQPQHSGYGRYGGPPQQGSYGGGYGGPQQGYGGPPPLQGGYGGPPPPQGGYGYEQQPQPGTSGASGKAGGGMFGGLLGGKLGKIPGGSGGGHGYPQQQAHYEKPPKKHGGMGAGAGMAMGAGAGLLGGVLLADALDGGFDDDMGGDFGDF